MIKVEGLQLVGSEAFNKNSFVGDPLLHYRTESWLAKRVDVLLPWLLGNLEIVEITVVCKLLQPIMQRRRISSGQQTEMFPSQKAVLVQQFKNLEISRRRREARFL